LLHKARQSRVAGQAYVRLTLRAEDFTVEGYNCMDNGTTSEVISQFDTISKLPDYWDHSQQYQEYLLRYIKGAKELCLDIGCGTGELTKKLSSKCKKAIGIDISKSMIDEAKKRNNQYNIEYHNVDIDSLLDNSEEMYDVVISIATFHHLDMERVLGKLKSRVKNGGMILILDLYKNKSVFEHLLSLIATISNPFIYLIKRGSIRNTKEEREAWKDHFQYDEYYTIDEIKDIADRTLGKVIIKYHLLWRYSLVYIKSEET